MTSLPSSFTRPRTLSASSSESSASSSSSSSTKSWSEGNFDLTSRGTSNTTSQQHVLLRTQFWEHASASNATTGLRSEKRSHLSNNALSTSLDRRGSTGARKRRTSEQVVSGSAVGSLAVPGRVVQLETPRTRTLTLALSKFSLKDNGTEGPERADEGQAESPQPKAEAEAHRPLKSSLASVSGPLSARSGSIKSQRKRREPSSPTESSPPGGKETPKRPTIVIIGSTPTSSVGQGTARPTHGRSLSLDIPDLLQYRSRTSPTPSTPSPPSSALSSPALSSDRAYYAFPPSPIPSFPPFTPQQHSPELPGDTVRILQPTTQPSNDIPHLTPSNPAYFIVPSTCDKRRRTVSSAPRHKSSDEALAPRPIKKRKQATNGALVPMFESPDANNGRPPLPALMPTAIDVVDFIKSKGGQCHEGDVFFRFRTGENEHVRNVVNMILDQFAIPLLGPDRRSYNHQPISIRMPRGFDNNGLREFGDRNEAVGSQGANCGTFSAFDRLLSQAATTVNNNKSSSPVMASTPGKCAIRGSCGSKGRFGPQLPCPYDGPPQEVEEDDFRTLLASVCGPELANSPVCCTAEQVQTLQSNFQQAETIISSCPACRNNFREFYCKFTCSPDQGDFISVTSTQETSTGETAVKSLDFRVSEQMGQGFFDSCKNVKFSATNGYAMDFIGGGAKNYSAFLQYMGDERPGLGSPFQINFPAPSDQTALDYRARDCSDSDLGSRCACIDCPNVCAVLPPIEPPSAGSHCQIGAISCLSFVIIVAYAVAVTSFITGFGIMAWRRKRSTSERAPLLDSNSVNGVAATVDPPIRASLVGASSLAQRDADQSSGALSDPRGLGHGLQTLINPFESSPPAYRLNTRIRRFFYKLGSLCASYPWLTLAAASVFIAGLNLGWTRFAVEVDPVRLWVPPTSETKIQKEYFDEHFGPFYRTQQIFISRAPSQEGEVAKGDGDEPVLSWDVLRWWMDIEEDIRNLRSSSNGYTLHDVCFKPAGPRGACVVQSIGAWFGNDLSGWDPDTWQDQVLTCASNPSACLPDYGQPLGPKYVLGGVPESNSPKRWLDAQAMVVTYVVSDSNDLNERAKAEEWERELKSYLEGVANSAQAEGVQIAYSTGVSLEEEINQSTNTDVRIVVLSYLVMFLYISMTLGGGSAVPDPDEKNVSILLRKWVGRLSGVVVNQEAEPQSSSFSFRTLSRKTLVGSKFMLGLFGIVLVIVSVSTSVGLFSFLGVKVTLIIAEVIPFLVLAVGVDNVFILVHELDRQNSLHGPNAPLHLNEASGGAPISPASYRSPFESQDSGDAESAMRSPLPAEERVARAVAKMGPSILLSSLTETIAFALGALVPMPAVRNFALYAAGSVFLGAVLQVTAFVAALTIDLRREEDNRVDCLPCIKIPQRIVLPTQHTSPRPGVLTRFMQKYYAPFLLKDSVKSAVVAAFAGLFAASVISMQHIKLGLDQRLALPSTSYLVPYFDAVDKYLDIGPPVYFVSTANNVTARDGQQNICGRFTTCDDYSLMNTLEGERNRPDASFIAEPPAGWFDDFFRWLDPQIDSCCRVRKTDPSVFCSARTPARLCKPCFEDRRPEWNITLYGMPEGEEFMRYLRQWLISPTDDECPLGGMAAYGSALALTDDGVEASHFRTFHTPLKSQDDFINAFASANRIANDISERTGTKVFPYSLFYVFFEQYIYIINITQEILGLGLAAVLIVTSVLLGSWRTGTIVTGVVGLTVVNVMGVMGIWGISLNAISLVNLVISLGIAVEFCSHIARAFMSAGPGLPADDGNSPKERNGRVWTALADVGPSVLSGITFTKLIGMSVLALTRSKLLEIYYFRMWLTLIISGALHGLVLLPVVLSLAGGPGFRDVDEDEEWMANAIRSADQEYAPFRTSSDFGDSD